MPTLKNRDDDSGVISTAVSYWKEKLTPKKPEPKKQGAAEKVVSDVKTKQATAKEISEYN